VTLPVNLEEKFKVAVVVVTSETKTLTFPSVEATMEGGDKNPADEKSIEIESAAVTVSAQVNIVSEASIISLDLLL
jgi:hypothetical protein